MLPPVLTKRAREIYNPFDSGGAPRARDPNDQMIHQIELEETLFALQFFSNGLVYYETRDELFADLAHDENTGGIVTDDPTDSYNGAYRKLGASGAGSWEFLYDIFPSLPVVNLENFDGEYDSGTTYAPGRLVQFEGSTWYSRTTTTGNSPPSFPDTSNTHWSLFNEGLSAYQVAVNNGFVGTEAQWLLSLEGADALVCDDVATVRALGLAVSQTTLYLSGWHAPGDGGGGYLNYDATDTTSVDDGFLVIVDTQGRRWKRDWKSMLFVTPLMAGAVANDAGQDAGAALELVATWSGQNQVPMFIPSVGETSGGGVCRYFL